MNQKQLEILTRSPKIKFEELNDTSDRTLLYGTITHLERSLSFHLYIKQEMFHFTAYDTNSKVSLGKIFKSFKYRDEITSDMFIIGDVFIQKKIPYFYPECCDNDFCTLLKSKGITLDFKKIDEDRPTKKFYGLLYDDMMKKSKVI